MLTSFAIYNFGQDSHRIELITLLTYERRQPPQPN